MRLRQGARQLGAHPPGRVPDMLFPVNSSFWRGLDAHCSGKVPEAHSQVSVLRRAYHTARMLPGMRQSQDT